MGAQGSPESKSETRDSKLSNTQADILKSREQMYKRYFFPELLGELRSTAGDGQTSQLAQGNLRNINQAYQGARDDINRNLAQRELTGGFQGSALAGLEIARANAASAAVSDANLQNRQLRQGLIGMGIGASPTPTTAVAYHQKSKTERMGKAEKMFS